MLHCWQFAGPKTRCTWLATFPASKQTCRNQQCHNQYRKQCKQSRHSGSVSVQAAASTAEVVSTGNAVTVTFSVPHRVRFGQHVCIVGATDALGDWDPVRGVAMTWTDGDIWQADIEIQAMNEVHVEYKYVVRDDTKQSVYWKPGSNCSLTLPLKLDAVPDSVRVMDDWDECISHVEVDYPGDADAAEAAEVDEMRDSIAASTTPAPAAGTIAGQFSYSFAEGELYQPGQDFQYQSDSSAGPSDTESDADETAAARTQEPAATPSKEDVVPVNGSWQQSTLEQATSSPAGKSQAAAQAASANKTQAAAQQDTAPRLRQANKMDLAALDEEDEIDIVAAAADRAMKKLDSTISTSVELLDTLPDPTTEAAFEADRVVAAAARKAIALTKAITAADPSYNYRALKAPKEPKGSLPDPMQAKDVDKEG